MDGAWFDNLGRALQGKVGSRRALASAVAGLSVLTISQVDADAKASKKKRRKRKNRKSNQDAERSVLLMESLVEQMQATSGDCNALVQSSTAFQELHAADLSEIAAIEQQWDAATRSKLVTTYEARITQATESLHTLMTTCRFRGAPEAAICTATGGTQNSATFSRPAAQCSGCDCSCICPISGWECAGMFFGCMGGSEASCCWFGACAGHICAEQCPNCCNCGPTCCGC